jgi:hypothetical protein
MNFTVEWTAEALDQLAALWRASADPPSVTAASYRIVSAILADPLGAGESREGDYRIVFDPPLAAVYRVYPAQQLALVTAVGLSRRPR